MSQLLRFANTAQCSPTAKCPYDGNSISDQELQDKMKGLVVVGTALSAAIVAVFVIVWIVVPISICLCCINKVKVCRPNIFFEFLHIHLGGFPPPAGPQGCFISFSKPFQ
jgi:hypothetical protein